MQAFVTKAVPPRGDGHEADARGLWDAETSVPQPHSRPDKRLTPPPPTPPAQRGSSFWRNVGAWEPRWTATPAVARYTAPPAPPQWLRRSAFACGLALAGLERRPALVSKTPV